MKSNELLKVCEGKVNSVQVIATGNNLGGFEDFVDVPFLLHKIGVSSTNDVVEIGFNNENELYNPKEYLDDFSYLAGNNQSPVGHGVLSYNDEIFNVYTIEDASPFLAFISIYDLAKLK